MLKKIIEKNIDLVTNKPKLILFIAGMFTIVSLLLASTLEMDLNWVALAPKGHPTVEEYISITENFSTMDHMIVVVESENKEELAKTVQIVEEELLKLEDYVTTVNTGIDTDFMMEKGLLYYPPEEIEMIGYMLVDPNLDTFYTLLVGNIEASMLAIEKGNLSDDEIAYQVASIEGMNLLVDATNSALLGESLDPEIETELQSALTRFFVGNGLITSPDGRMAMLTILPSFDMMDMEKLVPGVNAIEETIKNISEANDEVTVRATGMHLVARDEMNSVTSDSQLTTVLSFVLILVVLYLAFRSIIAPLLSFVPLIFGIIWSMGITAITIGRLNMITAFCSAMLLGLGIDYAIHMYSSYSEKRSKGYDKKNAIHLSLGVTGPGIIIGALTTAIAFFALNVSSLEILSELGTVMGTGIITSLLAVFWVLPALIMLKKEKETEIAKIKGEFKVIGNFALKVNQHKRLWIIIVIIITGFMATKIQDVRFDTNLMNLEPKGLESIELMNYLVEKYDMSADSFSVEVDNLLDVYAYQEKFEAIDGVFEVSSVATVLPKEEAQKKSIESIDEVKTFLDMQLPQRDLNTDITSLVLRELATSTNKYKEVWLSNELKGLTEEDFLNVSNSIDELMITMNTDINDENLSKTSAIFYQEFKAIGDSMLTDEMITISNLPEAFKSQFVSKDGKHFLITIIPEFDIWSNLDTPKGETFIQALVDVDQGVTGTPFFMKVLYDSAGEEVMMTGILLFSLLIGVLFLHFKSVKYALLAFLPLLFTIIFMLGVMAIIDLPFNMINFLAILLVIGIGLDDGVHILHHYKEGDTDIRHLFSSVGRAILLTTVTTVVGFGSMAFSSYRGISTLGVALAIGVTAAFIMTVVILPIFLTNMSTVTSEVTKMMVEEVGAEADSVGLY